MKGLDLILYIQDKPVAAQTSAHLQRTTHTADISNKIALDWDDFAIGSKSWSISCSGAYVVNDLGLQALEDAYEQGEAVDIVLKKDGVLAYTGKAIITSFPIAAPYNMDATYSMVLQGKGALARV